MSVTARQKFLDESLLLDLETTHNGHLRRIGAVLGEQTFERSGRFMLATALDELDAFAAPAARLLGHNLLGHDLPFLDTLAPRLALLRKPVVDTLHLSPLAFPKNPYHPLIKHYKDDSLQRQTENDPVADARLAGRAFEMEWDEFARLVAAGDMAPAVFRFCLDAATGRASGLASALEATGAARLGASEAVDAIGSLATPHACDAAVANLLDEVRGGGVDLRPLAFCLSWLRVAGTNSILPHWVRHQFSGVAPLVRRLRDAPCNNPSCAYCSEVHDPVGQLRAFFGLEGFVEKPAAPDGTSLQAAIVRAGMADRPLLAIMPTGAGKSIAFQLPALSRYTRRGALTVVISPLQALMKDQVEGLNSRTQGHLAAAIFGNLTPPERAQVLAAVRLGDVAVLYVSPEQLRNRSVRAALTSREIGCWVFDEAHCLSQWGHDFRPDYLYAARYIRELAAQQGVAPPPVACFTATAKRDVEKEILAHFKEGRDGLGQELQVFAAGVARANLHFEVRIVDVTAKLGAIRDLLGDELGLGVGNAPRGSAIVYFGTRKATEEAADALRRAGLSVDCFHAGLDPAVKRRVQDDFLSGALPIICATNAFGMGIDKSDVRLVIHADVPGTLENYLQEAGRAGRDRGDARCVLLYSESDVESQFRQLAGSQLSRRDIAAILKGLKRARARGSDEVVITTSELVRDEEVDTSFDAEDRSADTKVKTAVAWLERAGLVERNENQTRVFQGRPRVRSLAEAEKRIASIQPPLLPAARDRWLALLSALMNAPPDEGLSADDLAVLPEVYRTLPERGVRTADGKAPGLLVLDSLLAMVRYGLIEDGLLCTAYVRWKVADNASLRFTRLAALDSALVALLRESNPDAEDKTWQSLSLRRLNQRLLDDGHASDLDSIRRLLKSLEWDGRGLSGNRGSIDLHYVAHDHYRVRLQRTWSDLTETADRRRAVARVALDAILGRVPAGQPAAADVLVSFALGDISRALDEDLILKNQVRDVLKAIERALTFLHEQKVIHLHQGLAVFRQAMTIRIRPESHGRGYTLGNHEELAHHYEERIFQVHVMAEYARLGAAKLEHALRLVTAYFSMEKSTFVREYFAGRRELLERATTQESYQRIVEALYNPVQASIVAAPPDDNLLVLAGPGAGKTRVVVHRVAWLVRVKRVPPRSILVLAFNRSAALEVRHRLRDLIDDDARGVTVQTYHGLALRLTGHALSATAERGREAPDFDALIEEAIRIFEPAAAPAGSASAVGNPALESPADDASVEARERALSGYSHILVDEYQDIDESQYRFISALAGRVASDPDRKLAILAVGDDDQNIYNFRGANVDFIRRFEKDYQARRHFLVENYRSTEHIIAAANQLIAVNQDRMKTGYPIRIDGRRATSSPAGGAWSTRDPVAEGRVQILAVTDRRSQAAAIRDEVLRLRALDPSLEWKDIAVLSRHRADLDPVRGALEDAGAPVRRAVPRDKMPPLLRLREVSTLLDALHSRRGVFVDGTALRAVVLSLAPAGGDTPWLRLIADVAEAWIEETGGTPQSAEDCTDYFVETLIETRREQTIGHGVLLSTIHGAKGMEFPHVLMLDGGGRSEGTKGSDEEERRVLYVGMTRARETLTLLERADSRDSLSRRLNGDCFLRRRAAPDKQTRPDVRFDLLGLAELWMDFAARYRSDHPIHDSIRALQPGDPVHLESRQESVVIVDSAGTIVAQLSRNGAQRVRPTLERVRAARVIAVVRRRLSDASADYPAQCPTWEVPVVELELLA